MRGSTRTRKSRHILNADGPMASMQSAQIALSTPSSISQAPAPSSSTARPPNSPGTTSSRIPSSGNAQPVMRANASSTTTYSQTTPSAATSRRGSLQRPSSRARRSSTSRRCRSMTSEIAKMASCPVLTSRSPRSMSSGAERTLPNMRVSPKISMRLTIAHLPRTPCPLPLQ